MMDYLRITRGVLHLLGAQTREMTGLGELRGVLTASLAALIISMNIICNIRGLPEAPINDQVIGIVAIIYGSSACFKVVYLQFKWRNNYDELMDFVDGWYLMDNPISKTFKDTALCRKFRVVYEGTVYGVSSLSAWWFSIPLFSDRRLLPVEPYSPLWDRESTPGFVFSCLMIMANTLVILPVIFVTENVMFFVCIGFHNRIENVRRRFQSVKTDDDHSQLLEAIKAHQEILRKLKVLEIPCGPLFFIQVFTSFIGACFMLFSAIKQEVESTEAYIRIFFCAVATYTHLLLYCWVGQNITNASDSLQFAIYNNQWYECSPKIRETFHMVETFTCRSVEIQSSFVVKMSLKTFHKVMTESYSFLMVLMRLTNKSSGKGDLVI
uniref:Odorant receptor n=1 Tax=Yemma signatus TaxID=300820 RepID=A0A385H500_9HEMI|nr:odorant receptor [Yemma signatus]